jgi:GH25 family lysozyme M1 (1,4-beta-N-acetylmuramidase)
MPTCRGIDVSAYQAPQDWAAHKRDGVVFAFAKASEGQHSRDARFAAHITGIKTADRPTPRAAPAGAFRMPRRRAR